MKHAGAAALDRLAPLLERLRTIEGIREKSPGVFYKKSRAFLHFHEDPAGLFADIRADDGAGFDRVQVDDPASHARLVERARRLAGE